MNTLRPSKLEHWQRPWPSENCAYNINIRIGQAKFNRESMKVAKDIKGIERRYRQNIRKVNAAQRGVMSMLGHDPYPNCESKDHFLFEHNHPGFCYRRDGEPRRFASLLESKTRKIVHDLEGKQGLLSTPAVNIISDSPVMAEILSSPQLIEILCDLRTTAVLISDKDLFSQFASTLMNSPNNPLPFKGGSPMECLTQYRTNLIEEFFDNLRIQMEIRCGLSGQKPLSNYLRTDTNSLQSPADTFVPLIDPVLPSKEWGEAVIERLRQAKLEDAAAMEEEQDRKPLPMDALLPFTINVNPLDGLNPKVKSSGLTEGASHNKESVQFLAPNNTVTQLTAIQTAATLTGSPDKVDVKTSTWPRITARSKTKRDEFDGFVKGLIVEVEKIAEIGKNMGQFQKRKQQYDAITNPLVRLLRKKSLFSSLTEDDLLFYEYDGGRRDAEHKMARDLNLNQPRPGGFTFRVPSRTDTAGDEHGSSNNETSHRTSRPLTGDLDAIHGRSSGLSLSYLQRKVHHLDPTRSILDGQKSMKRMCCQACNAKLRGICNDAQKRDQRDRDQAEAKVWKTAGFSKDWTRNAYKDSKPHHLLTAIPLTLRKNYATYSPERNFASEAETPVGYESLQYLDSNSPIHRGLPTPAGRRKNLFPEVTRLISSGREVESLEHPRSGPQSVFTLNRANFESRFSSRMQQSRNDLGAAVTGSSGTFLDGNSTGSWTLRVDKMDIMKLRHELETANVQEKLSHFERVYLDSIAERLLKD